MDLAMKVILTGAAQGIGLGILELFLAEGHEVAAVDPAYPKSSFGPGRSQPEHRFSTDVSSDAAVTSMVEDAARAMNGIDVVINNAGIGGVRKPIAEFSNEEWRIVHAVNLDGPFYLIRAALPHLRRSKQPSIINVVTTSVKTGLPLRTPYVTSKAALLAMTQTLARELGPEGIRCNAILPGAIDNERGDNLLRARADRMGVSFEEAKRYRLGFVSMRTRMRPKDLAEMALFLSSTKAERVTGQAVAVDGNVEWED
jgi:NAD(P)-dependent dehydrogenase (short-subunit alcohol dehydrogenase family)